MIELFYVVAFVLLGAGATIGEKLDRGSIVNRPRNPVPLRLISATAGVAGVAWFIYGFFPFSWWLPLTSVLAFAVIGAVIAHHALRSYHAPIFSILSSFFGFASAVGVLVASG